ncbi:MAG: response regulator [Deltaproteobacteria bacterium]
MRALVIDDSRAMRAILGKVLREIHIECVDAKHGGDGLASLEADPHVDFVLCDWHMPEMDGCEFIRAVRAHPTLKALPIIMVSSESEGGRVATALEAGANEYIMKPFTPDAIMLKLQMLGLAPPVDLA